jgi:hypothetical protein
MLTRVAWVVVLAVAVAAGVVYGWPFVDERYIQPVRDNSAAIAALDQRLGQAEASVAGLEPLNADIESRVTALEGGQVEMNDRLSELDRRIAQHSTRLDQLDRAAAELEASDADAAGSAQAELTVLRGMELLSRARLFLYEANYGLAAQDLTSARRLLAGIDPSNVGGVPIDETLVRIDLALAALPDRPVVASDDLDIAWQTLLGEVPAASPSANSSTTTSSSTVAS